MSKIPEAILQDGCAAYAKTFLHGNGSLGDGIEAAYLTIQEHDDWVRAGPETWTGEGLPPVGMVCEYNDLISHKWHRVRILAHFTNKVPVAVFIPNDESQNKNVDQAIAECFRLIRTAEQIAAGERKAGIEAMIEDVKKINGNGYYSIAEDLYDAGYRKQVAK